MDLLVCINTYIPLHAAPSHRSEMVSQILFGERFSIIESSGSWLKIETLFDRYSGWIDSLHEGFIRFNEDGPGVITGQEMDCTMEDGTRLRLFPGSELFNLSKDMSSFRLAGITYAILSPHPSLLH